MSNKDEYQGRNPYNNNTNNKTNNQSKVKSVIEQLQKSTISKYSTPIIVGSNVRSLISNFDKFKREPVKPNGTWKKVFKSSDNGKTNSSDANRQEDVEMELSNELSQDVSMSDSQEKSKSSDFNFVLQESDLQKETLEKIEMLKREAIRDIAQSSISTNESSSDFKLDEQIKNLITSRVNSIFNYSTYSSMLEISKAPPLEEGWVFLDESESDNKLTKQHQRATKVQSAIGPTIIGEDISWSSKVGKEVANKFEAQERLRQESIYELIYSELCFRDDMKALLNYYYYPMKEKVKEKELSEKEFNEVFSNLPEIFEFSNELAEALSKKQEEDQFIVKCIGDVFLVFAQRVLVYQPYIQNYIKASQLLVDKSNYDWDDSFDELVKELELKTMPTVFKLNDNLIKPMQRLTKLPLLINGILKYTPVDHEDRSNLEQSLLTLQSNINVINKNS